jgi:hypothetical protein
MVSRIDGFLKRYEPRASGIVALNGDVPLCLCSEIIVGARRSDGVSLRVILTQDHLTLRFSAEDFPRLLTISNSTFWPSLSVDRPAFSRQKYAQTHPARRPEVG